ncbi:MAG: hypothetical protein KatS3mg002_1542 [Candidatus Woesearchaeota archaeon]|nr:MAG: hypothetical protein KatS3mg002_1542 [Candidatus Woesearchaeota archaeon]
MKHSYKRITKLFVTILLVLLFILLLRSDLNNTYPKGVDTYDLSYLSKSIKENHYIVWNINLPTVLGLTSFSYPPGGIIFLAEVSELTNLGIIESIILWNYFFIITCGLTFFLITKKIFKNNVVAIISTIVYLSSKFFIGYSQSYTSRNILHLLFLSILLLLLEKIDMKKIIIIMLLLIISIITHRAVILILLFLIIFIISKFLNKFYKNNNYQNLCIIILTVLTFLSMIHFFGHVKIGTESTKIPFNIGITYIDNIISILYTISMHFGILIILLPVGYYFLVIKKEKTFEDFFILISWIILSGLLVETIYAFYFIVPIIVITISYYTIKIQSLNNKIKYQIILALIILAPIVPMYITVSDSSDDYTFVRPQTLSLGSFLEGSINQSIICNNHVIYCAQISGISNKIKSSTHASGRTIIEQIEIETIQISLTNLRSQITVKDKTLETPLYADSYTSAIINWDISIPDLEKLLELTNVKYIIDSTNPDSIRNRPNIEKKFGYMNQIYNNGLQQIKVIE